MKPPTTSSVIRHFAAAYPVRTALLVVLLLLSGLAEGIGVASLLPLLDLAMAGAGTEQQAGSSSLLPFLQRTGLSPSLPTFLLIITLGMIAKGVFRLLAMKQVGYTVARVSTDLRLNLVRALLESRWDVFIGQQSGRFSNAIAAEADRAAVAYRAVCSLLSAMMQVLVYALLAILISWKVAVFGIAGGVLVVLVLGRLVDVARQAGDSQTRLMRALVTRLTDALQGIKPIKAMGREGHLQPLLEAETIGINRAKERQVLAAEALLAAQEPLLVMLLTPALFLTLTYGGHSLAEVLVMGFVFYRLAGRISVAQIEYQSIGMGQSAFASMIETIDMARASREVVADRGIAPTLRDGIVLEDVSFSYGGMPLFQGLNLSIAAGSFVALTGPSGAGKTTIADLIVGLYRPVSGRILIDNVDLSSLDMAAWRKSIGYVPQEMFLFHDSMYRNVSLGDEGVSRDAVIEALRAAGAWGFVKRLPDGIDTVVGERGARFSGGQRQRIAIARALVCKPKLLILDEVTTALDPATEQALCNTIAQLRGTTVLAISHQPALCAIADQVYELREGSMRVTRESLTA